MKTTNAQDTRTLFCNNESCEVVSVNFETHEVVDCPECCFAEHKCKCFLCQNNKTSHCGELFHCHECDGILDDSNVSLSIRRKELLAEIAEILA